MRAEYIGRAPGRGRGIANDHELLIRSCISRVINPELFSKKKLKGYVQTVANLRRFAFRAKERYLLIWICVRRPDGLVSGLGRALIRPHALVFLCSDTRSLAIKATVSRGKEFYIFYNKSQCGFGSRLPGIRLSMSHYDLPGFEPAPDKS